MREARYDDLVEFSSLLWKWMSDDKNSAALDHVVQRASELYQEDRRLAKIPLGDPNDFLSDEDFYMLSNFDEESFKLLVSYLDSIKLKLKRGEASEKLVNRILDISKEFGNQEQRWHECEFSQEEFETLKAILAVGSQKHPTLIKKLLRQNDDQNQVGFQSYVNGARSYLNEAGKVVSQAGNVVKAVVATGYSAVVDHFIPNSAMGLQRSALSSKELILSIGKEIGSAWECETSVPHLTRTWPSLNMRLIDEVSRAFYNNQVLSSDPSVGSEQRLRDIESTGTHDLGRFGDEQYVVLSENTEEIDNGKQPSSNRAQVNKGELGVLDLFAKGIISPREKTNHAFAIYLGLLTLNHEHNQAKNASGLSQASVKGPSVSRQQEDFSLTTYSTSVNFFSASAVAAASAASASSGNDQPDMVFLNDEHSERGCEFCLVEPTNKF